MKKNKNITAYSIQDFSQCQHKTWLDFLENPKDFSKNYDPWLEIIRKIVVVRASHLCLVEKVKEDIKRRREQKSKKEVSFVR